MSQPRITCHLLLHPETLRPARDGEALRQDLTAHYALTALFSHDVTRTGLITVSVPTGMLHALATDPAVWRVLKVVESTESLQEGRDTVARQDPNHTNHPPEYWSSSAWEGALALLGDDEEARPLLKRLDLVRPGAGPTDSAGQEARLIAVWMLLDVLAGSLNPLGCQCWFARPRVHLGGRTPLSKLRAGWQPGRPAYSSVLALALGDAGFAAT